MASILQSNNICSFRILGQTLLKIKIVVSHNLENNFSRSVASQVREHSEILKPRIQIETFSGFRLCYIR